MLDVDYGSYPVSLHVQWVVILTPVLTINNSS